MKNVCYGISEFVDRYCKESVPTKELDVNKRSATDLYSPKDTVAKFVVRLTVLYT